MINFVSRLSAIFSIKHCSTYFIKHMLDCALIFTPAYLDNIKQVLVYLVKICVSLCMQETEMDGK